MKYSEATKLIKGLSQKYSIDNNGKRYFEIIYKSKSIAWVYKQEQFHFERANTSDSEFDKLPYSHKLWMILAELAMTSLDKRKDEHKWNIVIGKDALDRYNIVCWEKLNYILKYAVCLTDSDQLNDKRYIFTDGEYNDLIKYIKTLPDGEWQAKVAEHGKTLVKGE